MYPTDRRYSKDHEWIVVEGEDAVIGITDFAQQELGDIVYVELPQAGQQVKAGDVLIARVPRFPRLLLPHLEERGLAWEVHEEADGTALVHVRRPA